MAMNRAVLWDMDGTLVDSAGYHWQAWSDTMSREGFPVTHQQFLATFGQAQRLYSPAVARGKGYARIDPGHR